MEWVETTAPTLEQAKERALDVLGVAEDDAEFEIVEEPRPGLFGRTRGQARVRARVRPVPARPKVDRRDRRKGRSPRAPRTDDAPRGAGGGTGVPDPDGHDAATIEGRDPEAIPTEPTIGRQRRPRRSAAPDPESLPSPSAEGSGPVPAGPTEAGRESALIPTPDPTGDPRPSTEDTMTPIDLDGQTTTVRTFMEDLLDAFDVDATISVEHPDEETIELVVEGPDLGLLVGPKGQTLQAIQELSRSVLQRQRPTETHARLRLDIAGYRQRRRVALERFTREVVEQVRSSGTATALEPMTPPDRKVVHDVVNEIEGITTWSEGEEPNRRVVIAPA